MPDRFGEKAMAKVSNNPDLQLALEEMDQRHADRKEERRLAQERVREAARKAKEERNAKRGK